jgi:fatty acid CoA ligase FadD9
MVVTYGGWLMAMNAWATDTIEGSGRTAELCDTDEQVRAAVPIPEITASIRRPGVSLGEMVDTVMTAYADRPALAERAVEPVTDPATGRTTLRLLPRFETTTYAEMYRQAGAVAAAWYHDDRHPMRADDMVATLGFTSAQHTTIDLACVLLGAVCVPLQAGGVSDQLKPIVDETAPRILATSVEYLDLAVKLAAESASVHQLFVFDYHAEDDDHRELLDAGRARLADAGSDVAVETYAGMVERGGRLPSAPAAPAEDGRLSLIIYTSGSTGLPKGAMYTQRLVAELWLSFFPERPGMPLLGINFMPWCHVLARGVLFGALARGGTAFFTAKSDLSTLFDDISLARPTELMLVPRVWDMLSERYRRDVDLRTAAGEDRAAAEDEVKTELREKLLGGRYLWSAYAGAPMSTELTEFVESVLRAPLWETYGTTEVSAVIADHKLMRDHVQDYRLEDVPELGYLTTDYPHPRGELLLKASTMIPGYFNRPDINAELLTEDGFYPTGDIMAETGPFEVHWVDRRKNVLKLSQGEFVAVSRLEALYVTSPMISQIYVYGNSERSYLLAVVIPSPAALERAGGDLDGVKPFVAESIQRIAREEGLHSYEIPRDFVVDTDPFTIENGMLSALRKQLRPKLKERYGEALEQLYTDLANREADELRQLRAAGRDRPVEETVARAARAVLGSSAGDLSLDVHFMELGGDSLSALVLSNLLQDVYDVAVPVAVVISPANDLRALAAHVARQLAGGASRPTAATVHGQQATEVRAADLTLDKFIDADTLDAAAALPGPADSVRTVLLTGANGYLGRFLCLEWLERVAATGGTVVCVVRGSDDAAARARLDAVFAGADESMGQRYRQLAQGHLEVLAGDVGDPELGLDEETWRRLADSVDAIVHAAALVNHVLPYDQLFGPNVAGTAELIRLAITGRRKPIAYLSSVGVLTDDPTIGDEDADIRVVNPARPLDGGYANGYSNTKWAGEVLLREAHERFDLPVTTFRSDMILAHRQYAGQLNVPDIFTRLLLSMIVTGIAPGSFYRTAAPAHYDGLPVDFIAKAITTLGSGTTKGYLTYNIVNPHEDGVSLDTIVDWLIAAGHSISRIDDYDEWFARFETALRALPQERKQYSLLPLLHVYAQPTEPIKGSEFPADRFRAAVDQAAIENDHEIPHITSTLINKYTEDLARLDLL